ncbi:MAG: carbohydrate binding family 9 domain-containing protein [Ignavibacteria bacterium]|nr:carbohydrate binding family 9 domain-containing protein [Ignavibacteria bacterium]
MRYLYLTLLLIYSINLFGQNNKIIIATKVNGSPELDGYLTDSLWLLAEPVNDFLQQEPIAGNPASFKTEVRIIYNEYALYIGVMCYDPEPQKIIARELKKDGNLRGDDNFMLVLDTFNDKKSAYWFGTNPLGMRDDALLSGYDFRGFNEDWDGIWDVRTAVTDSGWSIEFEFPFSTFKFHNQVEQVWGINFARQIRRLNEQVLWSSVGLNLGLFKLAYAGKLLGIKNIQRGNPIYFKPFLSAGIQQHNGQKKSLIKPGIDIKYGLTQNLSLDLTFNTDFAQVESDRARINLSRFPLFFPEKRDFFLENASIFDYTFGFRNNVFYSRRIGLSRGTEIPINFGARIVGRIHDLEVGFLNVQTASKGSEPTTNYGVIRTKYDLLEQSYVGLILTNKMSKNGFNRVYGGDFNFTFTDFLDNQTITFGGGAVRSEETNGGKKNIAYKAFISFPNDLINAFLSYREAQKDFNPAMGFFFRTGFKSITSHLRVSPRINYMGIKKLNFTIFESDIYWNTNNELSTSNLYFSPFGITTNADDNFRIDLHRNFDLVENDFNLFDTIVVKSGKYNFNSTGFSINTSRSRKIFVELDFNEGTFYSGKRRNISSELTYMFSSNLSLSTDFDLNRIDIQGAKFYTKEFGMRIRYDFSTMTYSSVFAQWNNELKELNINYRFLWQPKIGSNFYFVINHLLSTENKIRTKDIVILTKFVWLIIV